MVPAAFGMAYSEAAHRHNRRANILECNALLSRSLLRLLRRSEPMLLPIRRVLQAIVSATLILQLDIPATAQAVGVPAGTHMTPHSGTLHVTQDNAIIRNIEIRGNVIIDADNVSMSNVRLVSTTENSALQVKDGADGFVLQDSEIDGGGATASAIDGYGQFLRNDIHGAENGINVTGPSLIRANYIHDLRNKNGSPHYDGIQVDGGRDVQIVENTIINENTQTSAVMLDNYFKGLSDITVERNRLMGGGYTIYIDGRFNGGAVVDASIKIINNQIGGGFYGDYALFEHKPVFYGNTPLDPPEADLKTGNNPR
jgi:hypothetical protein